MSFQSFYSPAGPSSAYGQGPSSLDSYSDRLGLAAPRHSLEQQTTQSQGSDEDTPKKKGGRPRDKAWEFFTDESTKNLAICRYCPWRTDHPKAFRMRAHVANCPGLPEHLKPSIEGWAEAAKAQDKVSHKRKEPPTAANASSAPSSKAMAASQSMSAQGSLSHDWPPPLGDKITSGGPSRDSAHSGQIKRQRTSIIDHDRDINELNQSPAQLHQLHHSQQHQPPPVQLHQPNSIAGLHSNHAALAASQKAAPPMAARSPITCHVLDSTSGKPAPEMQVRLDRLGPNGFGLLSQSVTDADGRCGQLLTPGTKITPGIFKITFFTSEYFSKRGITSFYPFVEVPFEVKTTDEHYHVPLLLSPFAFSTYRGS